MENLRIDAEASRQPGDLEQLAYAANLLLREDALGPGGTGRVSLKRVETDLLREQEQILYIDSRPMPVAQIAAGDFSPLRAGRLARLAGLDQATPAQLANELACSRARAEAPIPPPEAVLHAALPYRVLLSGEPEAVLSIACTPGGPGRLRELYGEALRVIPYQPNPLALARACLQALDGATGKLAGIFLLYTGLITFGETPRQAYERMLDLASRAEAFLESRAAWRLPALQAEEAGRRLGPDLAALRKDISTAAGRPLILSTAPGAASLAPFLRGEAAAQAPPGAASARQVPFTRRLPMVGRDLGDYQAACQAAWRAVFTQEPPPEMDCTPRIILDPELGLCSLGRTAGEARLAGQLYRRTLDIAHRATLLEEYQPFPERECLEVEVSAGLNAPAGETRALFSGEVALVTGGASGIGKACVEALLRRGAAVASLDISPKVTTLFASPDFLGLECDLTDEAAVLRGFEALARAYGGLDMLVLNAGVFPASCRIEALSLAEWQRVMRINLDSNLVVLREAYPLLKQSPGGGRVLVNASKNVLAPGAGAAAYSASKAAVTQMARVAALEWGKDHIRVNLIHPDAVFDTGIWTEEVLKARAAHYGLTVQQYKTRNVLGVEMNSRYVGELVAEMLGPRFEKITGAQIPVDGGSDRVI